MVRSCRTCWGDSAPIVELCPDCGGTGLEVEPSPYRVGVIAGRHPMPVDVYLLYDAQADVHKGAYWAAYAAAQELFIPAGITWVTLYPTGLTNATLGGLAGFRARNTHPVQIVSFDRDTGGYVYVASQLVELHG